MKLRAPERVLFISKIYGVTCKSMKNSTSVKHYQRHFKETEVVDFFNLNK